MTQTQLAASLGVRERTVSRWESGTNQPEIQYLRGLARILRLSVAELLGADEPSDEPLGAVA